MADIGITRYLSAEKLIKDDFDEPFTGLVGEFVYDAKTDLGPWATMTQTSRLLHCRHHPALGLGLGQMYVRTEEGTLILIAGAK